MVKNIVFQLVVIFFLLAVPLPAQACMGYMMEDTLFFAKIPPEAAGADIVADVVIKTDNSRSGGADRPDGVEAEIRAVQKGDVKTGDRVFLKFLSTSCGPWHESGETGTIAARKIGVENGMPVLHPYLARRGGAHVAPAKIP